MKFHVMGANKETGDDIEVDLVAADTKQAEDLAHDRGILVASLKPIEEPIAPSDPIELEPDLQLLRPPPPPMPRHRIPTPATTTTRRLMRILTPLTPHALHDGHAPHADSHHTDNTPSIFLQPHGIQSSP